MDRSSASRAAVSELVEKLRATPGTRVHKLLTLYLSKFPGGASKEEARAVLRANPDTPLSVLREFLARFQRDRSLWSPDRQLRLELKEYGSGLHRLELLPLAGALQPDMTFWFHQCVNIPIVGPGEGPTQAEPYIVLSEPLFFACPSLKAYFRFLDINYDDSFDVHESAEIVSATRERLLRSAPESMAALINNIDLIPVRLYLPAGDTYAKTEIRRWFRNSLDHRVGVRSALAISIMNSLRHNLIVLASRPSLPLLDRFQRNNRVRLTLTSAGVALNENELKDKVSPKEGTSLTRVIVSNWTYPTGRVHTFIASNHTRAIEAVAKVLVNRSHPLLKEIADALTITGKIPQCFQIAFEVRLSMHETEVINIRLLPELEGRPLVYDTVEPEL